MAPATDTSPVTPTEYDRRPFLRSFLAVAAAGLLGVAGLAVTLLLQFDRAPPSDALAVPVLVALSLVTPAVLVLAAAAVGTALAPALGFRSLIAERARGNPGVFAELAPDVPVAAALGVGFAVVAVGVDVATSLAGGTLATVPPSVRADATRAVLETLPLRLLYGGIAEEVMLRWGVMTLFAWVGWRLTGSGEPSARLVWTAVLLSALAFGLGHLPALAATAPLTPWLVARTVLLNALGGVAFGWLFWRRSLEAAMVSHAAFHVVVVTVSLVWIAAL